MKRPRFGRLIGGALGATVLVTAALITPALSFAANAQVTYSLTMGSNCVEGFAPPSASLRIVWRSSSGALKGSADVTASEVSGYWTLCVGNGSYLAVGDRLKAVKGSYVRKYAVPPVTIDVDRVVDDFHGTAPAGTRLTLWYIYGGCCADFEQHEDLVADSTGHWMFSDGYPTDRFNGRVEWTSAKGDFISASEQASGVGVTIGRSTVGVTGDAHSNFRIVLRNGPTGARKAVARGVLDQYGQSGAVFLDSAGHPVNVAVGDRVDGTSVESDIKFLVRDIEISADVPTDVVDGRCLNASTGGSLSTTRYHRARGFAFFGVESDGSFSIWMNDSETLGYDPTNIRHGDKIRVTCYLAKGDALSRAIVVP